MSERRGLDIQRKVEKEEGVRKKGERGGRMNTGRGRMKKEAGSRTEKDGRRNDEGRRR